MLVPTSFVMNSLSVNFATVINKMFFDTVISEEALNTPKFSPNLKPETVQFFRNLMQEHKVLFRNELGCLKDYEYEVKLKYYQPFRRNPYPLSLPKLAEVRKQVQEMLDEGVIEEIESE